jgi:hypothetical protein
MLPQPSEPPLVPRRVVSANLVWERRNPPYWSAKLECGHDRPVLGLRPWDPIWEELCLWCVPSR